MTEKEKEKMIELLFSNLNNQEETLKNNQDCWNLFNYDNCSLGSNCEQQDSLMDCYCCIAGCPTSPNSIQQESDSTEINQQNQQNQSNHQLNQQNLIMSPSVTSTGLSINEIDEINSLPSPIIQNQINSPMDQDIIWINKELEELIKCCCCDLPTQSETLPLHHAGAHPTHHVNFDMLFNPSLNLPNKTNLEHSHHSIQPILPNQLPNTSDQEPSNKFRCQWNECNLEFRDRLELTEHVNLCHLFHSTSIDYNSSIQACDNHTTSQKIHQPSPNMFTSQSNHHSHSTIPTTDLFKNHINGFLLDSHSSTSSLFTHTPLRPSSSIQSFSEQIADQIASSSRQPNQKGLLAPNSSTITSKSSCESIYDFFNHHQPTTPNSNIIPLTSDEHQLRTVQANFPTPHTSPPVISVNEPVVEPQTSKKNSHDLPTSTTTEQHLCCWESCTGKSFSTTTELTKHISNNHIGSGKSSYECLWENCCCDRESSRSAAKEQAQKEIEAGKIDGEVRNLDHSHDINLHSKGKKRKTFNQRQKIMRHLQTHTGDRPFQCEICGKRFGEMATLVQHTRTHTQEKPYKCTIPDCGKSFALQSALTIHTRTHTGLKPFKCPVQGCKSVFAESSNLSKHLKIHSNLKKFPCHLCDKKFTRSDQLQRHLKSDSTH